METKAQVEKVVADGRKINQVVARGSYGPEAARQAASAAASPSNATEALLLALR